MSIPKKIHFVWVGGNEKPEDIKRCMRSWQQHLKGYEICEWNESNFDVDAHPYTKAAYKAKKWAYVSDYIRAYAIYSQGGIYLDTDVLVLDNFDSFLHDRAFVGFEHPNYPFTAVFGAEKEHPFLKHMLDFYDNNAFMFDQNDQLKYVNTKTVSDILIQDFDCKVGNEKQLLREGIVVYPDTVLCNPSKDSVSIHIFTGTWMEGKKEWLRNVVKWLKLRLTTKRRAQFYQKIVGRS